MRIENRMRAGIIEAARELNVNLICFTQLETISKDSVSYGKDAERFHHIHTYSQTISSEFEIDGLLFLGWSILLEGDHFDDFDDDLPISPYSALAKSIRRFLVCIVMVEYKLVK